MMKIRQALKQFGRSKQASRFALIRDVAEHVETLTMSDEYRAEFPAAYIAVLVKQARHREKAARRIAQWVRKGSRHD